MNEYVQNSVTSVLVIATYSLLIVVTKQYFTFKIFTIIFRICLKTASGGWGQGMLCRAYHAF